MREEISIPDEFQKIINDLLGNESKSFFDVLNSSSPASIRVNPNKTFSPQNASEIPWAKCGAYLDERPIYTLDPSLHAGAYYVQEPSSMFLEQAITHSIDLHQNITALDLCAAPGGKSTHLLSLLNPQSLLVSNEVIRSRANILMENLLKWGSPNVIITNNDPSHFTNLRGLFDLVVVDAPCSGEGLFRKDHNAIKEWSLNNVELCSSRQRRILKDIWPTLKQNGVLIFSTCTYNSLEDEDTMEWLSQTGACEFISIPLDPAWGVTEVKKGNVIGYKFYPHKAKGEGFFISVLRKQEHENEIKLHTKDNLNTISKNESMIKSWIKTPDQFSFINVRGLISIIPNNTFDPVNLLSSRLNALQIGTPLAINKQNKLVPDHGSALSIHLDRDHFTNIELDQEQALQYLRKETLEIKSNEKGFALVSFQGNAIGWINLLTNRINNLYPPNWRIRMRKEQ